MSKHTDGITVMTHTAQRMVLMPRLPDDYEAAAKKVEQDGGTGTGFSITNPACSPAQHTLPSIVQ